VKRPTHPAQERIEIGGAELFVAPAPAWRTGAAPVHLM
jgi:hypothetical protein